MRYPRIATLLAAMLLCIATSGTVLADDFDPQACIASGVAGDGVLCSFWYSDERWSFVVVYELGPAAKAAAEQAVAEFNAANGTALSVGDDATAFIAFRDRRNHRFGAPSVLYRTVIQPGPMIGIGVDDGESPLGAVLIPLLVPTPADIVSKRKVDSLGLTDEAIMVHRTIVSDDGVLSLETKFTRTESDVRPARGVLEHATGDSDFTFRSSNNQPQLQRLLTQRGTRVSLVEGGLPTVNFVNKVKVKVNLVDPVLQTLLTDPLNTLLEAREFRGDEYIYTIL